MGRDPVNRNVRIILFAVGFIAATLLVAKCAYGTGEWIGRH
ncbi:MAG TPA: hypothetical protein VFO32_01775 [Sphingomicrobium sp.]|nr:hypothetical protein [Sphingomicrobium sp.]